MNPWALQDVHRKIYEFIMTARRTVRRRLDDDSVRGADIAPPPLAD